MMPFDQSNSESVLFVGLVCIDNFFVVEKYPEEDSDPQPSSSTLDDAEDISNESSQSKYTV